jgi:hypothetical protein
MAKTCRLAVKDWKDFQSCFSTFDSFTDSGLAIKPSSLSSVGSTILESTASNVIASTAFSYTSNNTEYVTFQYQQDPVPYEQQFYYTQQPVPVVATQTATAFGTSNHPGQTVTYQIPVQQGLHQDVQVQVVNQHQHQQLQQQQQQVIVQQPPDLQPPRSVSGDKMALILAPKPNRSTAAAAAVMIKCEPDPKPKAETGSSLIPEATNPDVCRYAAKVIRETKESLKGGSTKRAFVVEMDLKSHDGVMTKFDKCWKEFQEFIQHEHQPTVQDYVGYFKHVKIVKKSKGSVLWTTFNRLHQVHHAKFKQDLRKIPELLELSQSFRKSTGFEDNGRRMSPDEIHRFLLDSSLDGDHYWLARKAFVVVAHFGNLR